MSWPTNSSRCVAFWLLAFFLAVVGAQCWLVWLYGSPLPFWDQWDEARTLFKPWRYGTLTFQDIAAPASDHRIILTHFLDLSLIWLNGRWDPLLEMAANALIHGVYACGLAFGLWHFTGRKNAWFVCGLLLPFFTLPFAGENAIWGMNSLWYFITLFALVTIAGLGFFRAGSWPWWIGLASALLGLLSMALGPVAPLAVGGLVLLRGSKARRLAREQLVTLAVCAVLLGLGLALTVRATGYRPLQAHSVWEFTAAYVRHLDWPFFRFPEMALLVPLPLVVLLGCYLRPNFAAARGAEFLLGLALWSLLASGMLAFGRANYGEAIPASRYTEVFSLLLIASLFATLLLGEHWRQNRRVTWNALLLPLAYATVIVWGLCQMSHLVVDNLLASTRTLNLIAEERVAAFVASGRDSDFLQSPTVRPDAEGALKILRDPQLQGILPPGCVPAAAAPVPGWLSRAAHLALRHGRDILFAGMFLFTGLGAWGLARGALELSWRNPACLIIVGAAVLALAGVARLHSLDRSAVEFGLQAQLAEQLQAAGYLQRAAIHARKAEALKSLP